MRSLIASAFIAAVSLSVPIPVPAVQAGDVERGRNIAASAAIADQPRSACQTCHDMQGAGDSSGAFPRLAGQPAWYLYKQMRDYATGLRKNDVMSPIAQALSDGQMQDVAAYYAAQTAPPTAQRDADSLRLQLGGAISASGIPDRGVAACVNCHGPAGQGLPPSFPYLAGQHAAYFRLQLRFYKNGARRNDPLGVMRHIARQLTDEEVAALAAYFASLHPPDAGRAVTR